MLPDSCSQFFLRNFLLDNISFCQGLVAIAGEGSVKCYSVALGEDKSQLQSGRWELAGDSRSIAEPREAPAPAHLQHVSFTIKICIHEDLGQDIYESVCVLLVPRPHPLNGPVLCEKTLCLLSFCLREGQRE